MFGNEVNADFFFCFTLGCNLQTRITWLVATTWESHVTRPRILGVLGAVDKQNMQVILLRLEQHSDSCTHLGLDCRRGREVVGECFTDVFNFDL